jgi:hypothetical protein
MTAASVRRRELPIRWIGLAAAALLALVFLSHLPFFFAWGAEYPLAYAFNYGWMLAILLLATAWTRTVPLRVLALAWFVGVYPVTGLILLFGVPLLETFGYEHAVLPGFLLPLMEELIKVVPILLLFWWTSRHAPWQLSATDGLLLGFMVGAGVAFHEDMMFGRTTGAGLGATPLSWILPTLYHEAGRTTAYHEVLLGLVGLAIGAAFMLRHRTPLAWVLPAVAWLLAFTEHWTWNYSIDPVAGEPFLTIATGLRTLLLDGTLVPALLLVGTIVAVAGETAVARSMSARDRLFATPSTSRMLDAVRAGRHALPRVQALREYSRRLRSAHYAVWAARGRELDAATVSEVVDALALRASAAGLAPRILPGARAPA